MYYIFKVFFFYTKRTVTEVPTPPIFPAVPSIHPAPRFFPVAVVPVPLGVGYAGMVSEISELLPPEIALVSVVGEDLQIGYGCIKIVIFKG